MDPPKENEKRTACYQCEKVEKCPYFQNYKQAGLLRYWRQGMLLRLCR
jgi:hypothetical protein